MTSNHIELIRNWEEAKKARKKAESWNDLPNNEKCANYKFEISIPHCKIPLLTRMGQKMAGGQTYWETGTSFNRAILEYIVSDWDNVYPKVIKILKEKEKIALLKCQSYIDTMQDMINKANDK